MTTPIETTRQAVDSVGSLLAVVNLVRTGRARTRPGLGQALGLGRAVIAQRVEHAIDLGYLAESELGASTGGRQPRTLRFRAERGRVLVCAVGSKHLRVGVSDLDGNVLASDRRLWDASAGAIPTLHTAGEMIDRLTLGLDDAPVWGVVVGVPGAVDPDTGRPVSTPTLPNWEGFDARGWFSQRFRAPVWVDSDVNLLAMAERERRTGTGPVDLLYLKVGTGIGVSYLFDGRLYRGAGGTAGTIGHLRDPLSDGVRCRCGQMDCLDATASGWALVERARHAVEAGQSTDLAAVHAERALQPEDVATAARGFDQLSLGLVADSARRTGTVVAALASALNPSVIVVGGAISSAGDAFVVPFTRTVEDAVPARILRDLTIVRSQGDIDEPVRGGNALAVEELFERTFSSWFADGAPVSPGR